MYIPVVTPREALYGSDNKEGCIYLILVELFLEIGKKDF
jgi:hypothetical protein